MATKNKVRTRTFDKYDAEIDAACAVPARQRQDIWDYPEGHVGRGGLLFQFLGANGLKKYSNPEFPGCVSQVKDGATTLYPHLDARIKQDERIVMPKDFARLTKKQFRKALEVYAEYQRAFDIVARPVSTENVVQV